MTITHNESDAPTIVIPQETEAKRQFWEGEVKRWKASGLSQRQYSEQRGLSKNQLSYWQQKLEVIKPLPQKSKPSFTPVQVQKDRIMPYIRIKRINGTCIEIPLLSDVQQLKALLEMLAC